VTGIPIVEAQPTAPRRAAERGHREVLPPAVLHNPGALNLRTSLVAIGVIALLGLLAWGLLNKGEGGLDAGDPVPVAELPALPDGEIRSLEDYRGEWVLLNVWASWCGPCREESPALEEFEQANRDDITVLGIDTRDLTDDALRFLDKYGIEYDQLRDADGRYADDLKTTGVPESFLIDPDGNLANQFKGPFRSLKEIEEFAAEAVAGESVSAQ